MRTGATSEGSRTHTDASLVNQQALNTDGKTFVTQLTFAIGAAHFEGLWGEIQGDQSGTRYYPANCTQSGCTFQVTLSCSIPATTKMTFHSGIYWRYITFTLAKPPRCGE